MDKIIKKVVFTGGPGGGKTTLVPHARKYLTSLGWHVIVISEMATVFVDSGVGPTKVIRDRVTALEFQRQVMLNQIRQEEASMGLALNLEAERIAIICDRGLLDQIAYVGEEAFEKLLMSVGITSLAAAKMRYDAVIHMVSAADGAEDFYINMEKDPNAPRAETLDQARALDGKTKSSWLGHPHFALIDNVGTAGFETKINRALRAIGNLLGIPQPFEIERKYLIKLPPMELLYSGEFKWYLICQHYLKSDIADAEERIRMEVGDGGVFYTHTTKVGAGLKRIEAERELSYREYHELQQRIDFERHPVVKLRFRTLYCNQVLEIDTYPGWKQNAILEVELHADDETVDLPDFIKVRREVTGLRVFSNYALSHPSHTEPV